jgi:hypothetical protein
MPAPYEVKRYTIDPVTPTEIRPPFSCRAIVVEQTDLDNDLLLYTTAADANTLKRIPPGAEKRITPEYRGMSPNGGGNLFFPVNTLVATVLSEAGTGPLVVEFYQ